MKKTLVAFCIAISLVGCAESGSQQDVEKVDSLVIDPSDTTLQAQTPDTLAKQSTIAPVKKPVQKKANKKSKQNKA